jgi:alpha-amylase
VLRTQYSAASRSFGVDRRRSAVVSQAAAAAPSAAPEKTQNLAEFDVAQTILLQGFGWDACEKGGWWNQLKDKLPDVASAGVSHIWLPPPSESVAPQGYLPGQLYNLNSKFGNQEELKALVAACKEAGVRPVCDIVVNHRCADAQDEHGIWNKFRDDVEHPGKSIAWGRWAITNNDPEFRGKGASDSGDDYGPAPDLDHTNQDVRESLTDWMSWLKSELGFMGWRFDFTKGFGAEFVKEYVQETGFDGAFNVGEFWTDLNWGPDGLEYDQNGPRQTLVDWIKGCDGVSTTFDFPTKGILQEAVKNTEYWRLIDPEGKPPGFLGWWPSKAVTFVDNHDTGSTQQHWPFPGDKTMVGYAYIMTHPGIPCIFWDHLFQHNQEMRDLIALRKRNNIHSRSKIAIKKADADMYVAIIDDKVTVKLGPRYDMGDVAPKQEEGWKRTLKGNDWAIWEKQS